MWAFIARSLIILSFCVGSWSHAEARHGARNQCLDIVAVGDSITDGQYTGGLTPWPQNIGTALGTTVQNKAISGATWTGLIPLAAAQVDPLRTTMTCATPYLALFAGTNDIYVGGATAAQTYASFVTYLTDRLAAGWIPNQILVFTMLPRDGADDTVRQSYIALQVAGAATYGYRVVRLDLDPNIGCAGCQSNAYYNGDLTHPTQMGLQVIANLGCLQMITVLSPRCPVY